LADAATAERPAPQPDWLAERRAKALDDARGLALPGPKVRGWEFTDLSGLDLSAFAPAEPAEAPGEATGEALSVPAGARGLTQVDGSVLGEVAAELSGNGRPEGAVVLPLDLAAARYS
jgi:Fe-S cluster assembly protein SufD